MPKKILYVSHVDWNWIKQRPQFIAEHLSRQCNVLVVYAFSKKRALLAKRSNEKVPRLPFFRFPFRHRFRFIETLNEAMVGIYFRILLALYRPDTVWLTYPELINYFPSQMRATLVYDAMDDVMGFSLPDDVKNRLLVSEKTLIQRASTVFASSQHLIEIFKKRFSIEKNIVLLRNAFNGDVMRPDEVHGGEGQTIKIGYVGTISSWFDFKSLLLALDHFPNLEFHLIGPSEIDTASYSHDRMRFYGPIDHGGLKPYLETFGAMIMPFNVNVLVESVDPVKLYDYINYNKPLIAVYYPEIERFSPFVSFYSTAEELVAVLTAFLKSGLKKKYTEAERLHFLNQNSWDVRAKKIMEQIS